MKIEIPIPAVSDCLFDSQIKPQTGEEDTTPGVEQPMIDDLNNYFKKIYREQHPTVEEFVEGK